MYLAYGSYTHASGEVQLQISRQSTYGENGIRRGSLVRWTIDGRLHAADIASLTTAIAALETAYSVDGYNLALYNDDASLTAHTLISSTSLSGVKIVSLDYPSGDGSQYTTYRDYRITAEAEYSVSSSNILNWNETLSFSGGGPLVVWLPALTGPPQRQIARQQTTYKCQQSGTATGLASYPAAAPPLFGPDVEHVSQRQFSLGTPRLTARGLGTEFPVSWSYSFESSSPLFGLPSTRIN